MLVNINILFQPSDMRFRVVVLVFLLCRCGKNLCAIHRYAEAHDCEFDYKSEGRTLIEKSNPVVTASKLPKI